MSNSNWFLVKRNPDAKKWITGAKTLIAVIQQTKHAHEDLRRILFNYLIWPIGEAGFLLNGGKKYRFKDGKLKREEMAAQYCSFEAGEMLKKGNGKGCRRDHVFGRENIIDRLLKNNSRVIKNIEKFAVVCLVTETEHNALTKIRDKTGWEKYAEIMPRLKILDRESGRQVPFKKLRRLRFPS